MVYKVEYVGEYTMTYSFMNVEDGFYWCLLEFTGGLIVITKEYYYGGSWLVWVVGGIYCE